VVGNPRYQHRISVHVEKH